MTTDTTFTNLEFLRLISESVDIRPLFDWYHERIKIEPRIASLYTPYDVRKMFYSSLITYTDANSLRAYLARKQQTSNFKKWLSETTYYYIMDMLFNYSGKTMIPPKDYTALLVFYANNYRDIKIFSSIENYNNEVNKIPTLTYDY